VLNDAAAAVLRANWREGVGPGTQSIQTPLLAVAWERAAAAIWAGFCPPAAGVAKPA
jgi:hypothetical protein